MDIQLILGPNNSGKSMLAEKIATQNIASPLIYIATMIPYTEDNHKRIAKHQRQRFGKGFTTIEEPWNIHNLDISFDSVVLLEDASNLLANGIFVYHSDAFGCFDQITALARRCKKLIVVSISGLIAEQYNEETVNYIQQLNLLNEMLEEISNHCIKLT